MGPSCPFETISISISILFDFAQEKTLQCVERTKKIRNFWTVWAGDRVAKSGRKQSKQNKHKLLSWVYYATNATNTVGIQVPSS